MTQTVYVSLDRPEPDHIAGPYAPRYVVGKPSIEKKFGVSESGLTLLSRSRSFYDGEVYKGLGYPGSGTAPGLTRGRLSARLDLAFTTSSFDVVFPAGSGAAAARDARGQYLVDGDEYYIHASRMAYHANGLPASYLDPNGNETTVEYDATYGLFPVRLTDPAGHPTILERGTLPFQVAALIDANDNRTEFTYDPTLFPRRNR